MTLWIKWLPYFFVATMIELHNAPPPFLDDLNSPILYHSPYKNSINLFKIDIKME